MAGRSEIWGKYNGEHNSREKDKDRKVTEDQTN